MLPMAESLSRLPEPPAPASERRQAAIADALAAFDQKYSAHAQGSDQDPRLMAQTASRPSRRRPVMTRARSLVAACVGVLIVTSAASLYVMEGIRPDVYSAAPTSRIAAPAPQIVTNEAST